jgi:hypothetical protein
MVYERHNSAIDSRFCIRYEDQVRNICHIENWDHVWICENNRLNEEEILLDTLIELENEYKDEKDKGDLYKAIRTIAREIYRRF